MKHVFFFVPALVFGCQSFAIDSASTTTAGSTDERDIVTFTVYTDSACTEVPPIDSVVQLDATQPCNETPDASISNLRCFADRITYTNHPNNDDCTADGIENELSVGMCQEFPGPVLTWKLIEAETYLCRTE
jgi:hypothetical protein